MQTHFIFGMTYIVLLANIIYRLNIFILPAYLLC